VLSWPPHARVAEFRVPHAMPEGPAAPPTPPRAAPPPPHASPPPVVPAEDTAYELEEMTTLRDGGGDDVLLADASGRRGEAGAAEPEADGRIATNGLASAPTSSRSGGDSARGQRCRICLDGVSGAEFEA
jgi:hypothetical protein